jgi:putative membrane protein
MHNGWMYGMGWGWILVLVAFGLLIWFALRTAGRSAGPALGNPEKVLKERFARGEIDEEEYRARLAALRDRS